MPRPEPANAKDILEVTSIHQLGLAVGTLTVLGYTDDEIVAMVHEHVELTRRNMANAAAATQENPA